MLRANDDYNRALSRRFVEKLEGHLPRGANVAVLGLAYKPMSHVIEESPGVYLCRALSEAGYRVVGHDVLAATYAAQALEATALVTDDLDEALKDADAVVVTTTDKVYANIGPDRLAKSDRSVTVIDFWRSLESLANDSRMKYIPIGIGADSAAKEQGLRNLWS